MERPRSGSRDGEEASPSRSRRAAPANPRRFQPLMELRKAQLEWYENKGVEINGLRVKDIRDSVKDKWNAKDIAAMEEARAGSASPRVRVRSPRRERPGERKREAEAYMKPLAITEARLAMTGRERDPRGILSTALFSEIKDSTAQVLASEADVRAAEAGVRRAVNMRHNAKVDFAAVGKGNSSQGCAGILLPHSVLGGGSENAIVSACVNTKRRLILTSDDRRLAYWAPGRAVASAPLPPGTTTRHLMYDRISNAVFAVRDDHRLVTLHSRQLTPMGTPKTSEDAILCATLGTRQRVIVTGHSRAALTIWRIHDPDIMKDASTASSAVRLIATQNFEPSGVTEGHFVNSVVVTEGDLDWVIAALATGVHIWDITAGTLLMRLEGLHDLPITALSFDEDTKYLATGSRDWSVRVWDMKKDVMETTVSLTAEDKRATLAETMSGHGQPVTGVLWEQASHVLLSVSVDGTLRMYDGKALEQWDMLQLVSTRVPALSECGIRTDGTELPDMVTPTGVHLVEAHSGGFYIGITVGPSVVFVDVQPSKKFRGTLPHPAVQIMPRAHTVPSWWPKGQPWSKDVLILDENGAISVLDTRTGSCSMDFQTQSSRVAALSSATVDNTRDDPFWIRAQRSGVERITTCMVLEEEDEVYVGWSKGGVEMQSFRPTSASAVHDISMRRQDLGMDHGLHKMFAITCMCRITPSALDAVDRSGLRRVLEMEEANKAIQTDRHMAAEAKAAEHAMRDFLKVLNVIRLGKRWRKKTRKPIVIYGTSTGLLVMTSRQHHVRPNISEGHRAPVVGVTAVDPRSAVVSVDRATEVRIWSFVPPQLLPQVLKTRSLAGLLVPMTKLNLKVTQVTITAFETWHIPPKPHEKAEEEEPETPWALLGRKVDPWGRKGTGAREGGKVEEEGEGKGGERDGEGQEQGRGVTKDGEEGEEKERGQSSSESTESDEERDKRGGSGRKVMRTVSKAVLNALSMQLRSNGLPPRGGPAKKRSFVEVATGVLEEDEQWSLRILAGGGAGDICVVELHDFPRATLEEVEEVLASMPNSGSALETCDVMRPGLASTTRGMRVLSHHTARVAALALSPALLASGDMSGNVVIWDRPSWAPLASMPFRRPVEHLCFVAPRDIIAVSEASMSQICIQEHVWVRSTTGAQEKALRDGLHNQKSGEYQYRYAIDFPEDSYLKAVQRVAYVTIFEPGSSELKELEHLFQQIKSTEDKEFDLEYALAMVEAEIRAQMEAADAEGGRSDTSGTETENGRGAFARRSVESRHRRRRTSTSHDHPPSPQVRAAHASRRPSLDSASPGPHSRTGLAQGSAESSGAEERGLGVTPEGRRHSRRLMNAGERGKRDAGEREEADERGTLPRVRGARGSLGRSEVVFDQAAGTSGGGQVRPSLLSRGSVRGEAWEEEGGRGRDARRAEEASRDRRELARKLGTTTARAMLTGAERGSFRAKTWSQKDAPREGRGLRHIDNAKQHMSKGILIPAAAHDLLQGRWSGANVDAIGGTWFDVLQATTLDATGQIPVPRNKKAAAKKARVAKKKKAAKDRRLQRKADALTADAYVSDLEEKLMSLGLADFKEAVAGMPLERPPTPQERPVQKRKKKRRRRKADPFAKAQRERVLRERMSRIRFVLTSMNLPRATDIGI